MEDDARNLEYTSRNFDAINKAVMGQSSIIGNKIEWLRTATREVRVRQFVTVFVGFSFVFFLAAILFWLFSKPALEIASKTEALSQHSRLFFPGTT